MGVFGHMRIHGSGIHRNADNTDTHAHHPLLPFSPTLPPPLPRKTSSQPLSIAPAHSTPATSTYASAWSVTCESNIRRLLNQCLGAPTYIRRARFHCPYCSHAFTHRMGLLGHMSLHDNLRYTIGS
ncbi:unnamed protein product [Schistocephalus solidus]|uniref:C2H2-type domain-containing protein n=1 Tax=Schistocephalus solidus TaxID=70667 RepID=A0A183TQ48_SCHSO|nr:unnamed protein product [Schistocephalus solidus]